MSDLKAKMHQNRFRLGLCPKPSWGDYRPGPPRGPTSKGKGGVQERWGARVGKEKTEGKGERERGEKWTFYDKAFRSYSITDRSDRMLYQAAFTGSKSDSG